MVEPFGDNSRYWIGPVAEDFTTDITEVMAVFERHQPGLWRRVLGDVVTLRFIKH